MDDGPSRARVQTHGNGVGDVLGEDKALELDDEEIHELVNVVEQTIDGPLG